MKDLVRSLNRSVNAVAIWVIGGTLCLLVFTDFPKLFVEVVKRTFN